MAKQEPLESVAPVKAKAFKPGYATEAEKLEAVYNYELKHPKAAGLEIGVVAGNTNESVRLRDKATREIAGKKFADGSTSKQPTADKRRQIQNRLFAHLMRYVRVRTNHDQPIEWPGVGEHRNTPECFEKLLNGFPDLRDEVIQAIHEATEGEEDAEATVAKN